MIYRALEQPRESANQPHEYALIWHITGLISQPKSLKQSNDDVESINHRGGIWRFHVNNVSYFSQALELSQIIYIFATSKPQWQAWKNAIRHSQEQQANEQQHIRQAVSQATTEKDKTIRLLESTLAINRKLLNTFAGFLFHTSETFKGTIQAIIHFGREQHQSFFVPSEATGIKNVMQEYGETTEQQNAAGAWLCDYAESRQSFDEIKHRHTLNDVGDVAEGKYDWKIKNGQGIGV